MKKKTGVIVFIVSILCFVSFFWVGVNLVPISKLNDENVYLKKEKTLISAHRGGSYINPENTEKAFDYVIQETSFTDIIEIDVHATKDDVLVINHDESINRTSLPTEENTYTVNIKDTNYVDLLKYNVGKNFTTKDGIKPYYDLNIEEAKDEKLTIMKFEDFLKKYKEIREFKIFLEIKSKNDEALRIAKLIHNLYSNDENEWWKTRTIIISFSQKVIDYFENEKIQVSPLGQEALAMPILCKFGLERLIQPKYQIVQIMAKPTYGIFSVNLATKRLIDYAHKRNQALTFWTVNEDKQMKDLIKLGADIITTDDPAKLNEIQNSMK